MYNLNLVDNVLKAEDFIRLKTATGFMDRPLLQVEEALKNGLLMFQQYVMGKLLGWVGLLVMELCIGICKKLLFCLNTKVTELERALLIDL